MGLWPIQWYGDFFHISIFSRDYKNSINGKYGPWRSQTILISYFNEIMWKKIAIIISILIIILSPSHSATVTWSVLKWNFLLPRRRSGFPFLRFFVSQLEPTRNSTPTYSSVIQIHHFSNFPEVQCFGRISGTYFGNIGSFQRKYQQWKKKKKNEPFSPLSTRVSGYEVSSLDCASCWPLKCLPVHQASSSTSANLHSR